MELEWVVCFAIQAESRAIITKGSKGIRKGQFQMKEKVYIAVETAADKILMSLCELGLLESRSTVPTTIHEVAKVRPREDVLLQVIESSSRDCLVPNRARESLRGFQPVYELSQHQFAIFG